ncbi:MAG: deoxyribose-phosphate aldolase [Oscillospiraceae bacterium]|nr:deoxyribose-phosphate aldolase [Oscillospiraceae bacterium]
METKELLRHIDHTLLRQTATWEDIRELCSDAIRFETASVCIPPSFVRRARDYVAGKMKICTVVGFPNGYATAAVKAFETADAVENGADELDMVIHLGLVKEGKDEAVLEELRAVRKACPGKILKVIVETCFLSREEKIRMCRLVSESGADYIKTSTGFAGGGATTEDVALFRTCLPPGVRIKAAGGIRTLEDAETMLQAGADRLGSSAIVQLAKEKAQAKRG